MLLGVTGGGDGVVRRHNGAVAAEKEEGKKIQKQRAMERGGAEEKMGGGILIIYWMDSKPTARLFVCWIAGEEQEDEHKEGERRCITRSAKKIAPWSPRCARGFGTHLWASKESYTPLSMLERITVRITPIIC